MVRGTKSLRKPKVVTFKVKVDWKQNFERVQAENKKLLASCDVMQDAINRQNDDIVRAWDNYERTRRELNVAASEREAAYKLIDELRRTLSALPLADQLVSNILAWYKP
jgi:hypothetical protein